MEAYCHWAITFRENELFQYRQRCTISTLPLLLCLHKVALQCRPQTSWILVVISSPHDICQYIHESDEQVWAQGRSLVQPYIHVESAAFASCNSRTLVWQPQYNVLYQFNIRFWYPALPRACPDLLPVYSIVFLGMKIASVVLLLCMNPN